MHELKNKMAGMRGKVPVQHTLSARTRGADIMTLRHAAALALLACVSLQACSETKGNPGWYRMLPPIADSKPNTAAPLPQWLITPKPYASEAECKADLPLRQKKALTEPHDAAFFLWPGVPGTESLLAEQQNAARCAYSDHPQFRTIIRINRESAERNPSNFNLSN